jgi:CRP-like cAMP-binding protein
LNMIFYEFLNITREDIAYWNKKLRDFPSKHFNPGNHLYRQDQPWTHVYFILKGTVKDYLMTEIGISLTFFIAQAPYYSGSGKQIEGHHYYCANCLAVTDVEAVLVHKDDINGLCVCDPYFSDILARLERIKMCRMHNHAETSSISLSCKLARFLFESRNFGFILWNTEPGVLNVTHQEISELICSSRSNVTRCLKDFENKAIISCSQRYIRILNIPALKAIAYPNWP